MYIWGLFLSWKKRNKETSQSEEQNTVCFGENLQVAIGYICVYVVCVCVCVCVYVCLYVYIYKCIYVCVYVYLIAYERSKFCTWIILRIWIFAHFIFYHCAWFSLVKLYSLSEQSVKNYILIQCSLKACCVFLKEEKILLS